MWFVTRSPCETCVDSPSAMGLPSGVRRTRKPWDTPSLYRTATDSAVSAVDESKERIKSKRSRPELARVIQSNILNHRRMLKFPPHAERSDGACLSRHAPHKRSIE